MSIFSHLYVESKILSPLHSASASLSPNGSNIAVSNVVRGFDVYKVQSEEPLISFDLPNDDSASFARSPVPVLFIHEGHALVGGSMNGKVDLWDLCMGKMHSVTLTSEFDCYFPPYLVLTAIAQSPAKYSHWMYASRS